MFGVCMSLSVRNCDKSPKLNKPNENNTDSTQCPLFWLTFLELGLKYKHPFPARVPSHSFFSPFFLSCLIGLPVLNLREVANAESRNRGRNAHRLFFVSPILFGGACLCRRRAGVRSDLLGIHRQLARKSSHQVCGQE